MLKLGSSPLFPGFLAPHGHNISHLYSMSLAHSKFEVLLVIVAYVEFIWSTLARFDNCYEICDLCWILSEFFHHPMSAWVKHISEVFDFWWRHWFELLWLYEDGIGWIWKLWSMLLRVFIFSIHLWSRVIAWGQASISLGMFDVCQKYMF